MEYRRRRPMTASRYVLPIILLMLFSHLYSWNEAHFTQEISRTLNSSPRTSTVIFNIVLYTLRGLTVMLIAFFFLRLIDHSRDKERLRKWEEQQKARYKRIVINGTAGAKIAQAILYIIEIGLFTGFIYIGLNALVPLLGDILNEFTQLSPLHKEWVLTGAQFLVFYPLIYFTTSFIHFIIAITGRKPKTTHGAIQSY